MTTAKQTVSPWWGQVELELNQLHYWHVGPSHIWSLRRASEWRLYHVQDDPADPSPPEQNPAEPPAEGVRTWRYSLAKTGRQLALSPLLAERAVIIKPAEPLLIPSGEEVRLYADSPVWLKFSAGKPLGELPSLRPSDTWFGPNTLEGELCYASRALGRLELSELELKPWRPVTPILIHNSASELLTLERLRLPVQHLSLYAGEEGSLWTQSVTLERQGDGELAELRLGRSAPREAGRSERLAQARTPAEQNLVVRAFSRLFRGED